MLPFTPEQIKLIKNHIPTVQRKTRVFLDVLDTQVSDEEKKLKYLIELIDSMDDDLKSVKDLLKDELG